jgi:hypothetical protein
VSPDTPSCCPDRCVQAGAALHASSDEGAGGATIAQSGCRGSSAGRCCTGTCNDSRRQASSSAPWSPPEFKAMEFDELAELGLHLTPALLAAAASTLTGPEKGPTAEERS